MRALDGLTLSAPAGGVFALLGPNGAGKSTTVKILTTLSHPDEGEASVAGIDVLRRPNEVRHVIGVVGQKLGFDLEATGRENLRLQGRLYGLGGGALERRIDELLERLRLGEAAERLARKYSGDMQRRLDIAMGSSTCRACCSWMSRRPVWIPRCAPRCGRSWTLWPPSRS